MSTVELKKRLVISGDEHELELRAEGSDSMIQSLSDTFIKCVESADFEISEDITEPERPIDIEHDVVVIYDNANLPSLMHRFRRTTDAELFGGSQKVHPAFIIGGEIYDEIYISVYQNTMINGKPYSLPMAKPVTDITLEDFEKACFSKGEGWHPMTAQEWGLIANLCAKSGVFPHGNTRYGKYHADENEHGEKYDNNRTLTGSGPVTWTHDHTPTGVHDLCGNVWEWLRGMRVKDGILYQCKDNDAALPETDLSKDGKDWETIKDDNGCVIRCGQDENGNLIFTTREDIEAEYAGDEWEDVNMEAQSETLKELAFYPGEKKAYCYADGTDGEYCLFRGGNWGDGASAGVFSSGLDYDRSSCNANLGGRSAYFKKHRTPCPETL